VSQKYHGIVWNHVTIAKKARKKIEVYR